MKVIRDIVDSIDGYVERPTIPEMRLLRRILACCEGRVSA